MKRLTILIISAITCMALALQARAASPSASALVADAAAKMRQATSLTVAFTANGGASGTATKGTFTLAADRFAIDTPTARVWYDGKTQWSWSREAGEVNITEPTIEEIAEVNPYAIINSLRTRYKASYIGNPSRRTVLLTPAMPRPTIKRAEITFGPDGYPSRLKITVASGDTLTLTVTSVKTGGRLPDTTFRFDPAKAPGAEVIDLR